MANKRETGRSKNTDALLAKALAEHEQRQLDTLLQSEPSNIGGGDHSAAQRFLDECRAKLEEIKKNQSDI